MSICSALSAMIIASSCITSLCIQLTVLILSADQASLQGRYFAAESQAKAGDGANLTIPNIKWLGLRPSDLDKLEINKLCRLPMTNEDMEMARSLVSLPAQYGNP